MSSYARSFRLIGVNFAVAVALLAGIELVVRMANPEITPIGTSKELIADSVFGGLHGPSPNTVGTSNGAVFSVDHRGFWKYDIDDVSDSASDRPGWLFIGDSVTMGMGVAPDSTFAGRLAHRLADDIEVLNPSLIGYNSGHYHTRIRHLLRSDARQIPTIRRISIFWCLNDAFSDSHVIQRTGWLNRRAEPLLSLARRYLYTYQWLKATLVDRPKRYFQHDALLYEGETLDQAVTDLSAIAELCETHRITCDLVLLPYEYQLRTRSAQPQAVLAARTKELSLRVFDPSDWMLRRGDDSASLYLYGDGIHLSKKGHRLVAEYLLRRVVPERPASSGS